MVDGAGAATVLQKGSRRAAMWPIAPLEVNIYILSPHTTYVGDTKVRARLTIDMLLECTVWARVPHFWNVDSNDRS